MVTLAQGAVDQCCPLLIWSFLLTKGEGRRAPGSRSASPPHTSFSLAGSQLDPAEVMQPSENGSSLGLGQAGGAGSCQARAPQLTTATVALQPCQPGLEPLDTNTANPISG